MSRPTFSTPPHPSPHPLVGRLKGWWVRGRPTCWSVNYRLVGWLVGWMVGWLVGWFGWLVGGSVGRFAGRSVGWLVGWRSADLSVGECVVAQLLAWSAGLPGDWMVDSFVDQPFGWLVGLAWIGLSVCRSVSWLVGWSVGRLVGRLVGWFVGWLVVWLVGLALMVSWLVGWLVG